MAPSNKESVTRRKSGKGLIVTLHVSPQKLKDIIEPLPVKESPPAASTPEIPEKEDVKEPVNGSTDSPTPSTTIPAPGASNGENASDSNPATPAVNGEGTPAPGTMGPPTDGPKKKGTKRSAAAANGVGSDGQAKSRGKPGPKKKARLDDELNGSGRGAGLHKLGPKANQGAINAGLRALDRSGKPCRKWSRGGFQVKSFTGVVWEIHRWTAPPKPAPEPVAEGSVAASADSSAKENKEIKSDEVNSPVPADSAADSSADAEMRNGGLENGIDASSPAPVPISAA
ncbi:DUF1711-domain-containing protein [Sodiomyces alkalinus F11]|uniref:DUF1711-domain-containing protein n=1 Tax=Sodiomyces alkalinus (strain CBS 110278 / VKM F-3762 / F11) TaxID=1314773 RepID=A0A3N2PLC0_SODAK|nr:DUF1711-domain-containing protein [Sodiomyces alkalinus F11]ROT35325.1 DUF1711-domain-containing protein [Sodiomyces alkalinus F11]